MEAGGSAAPVIVIGAGIGGLTTALALGRRGIPVVVLEQAEGIEPVGAGIQVSPNAVRVLRALGVDPELGGMAVHPDALEIRDHLGALIVRTPLGAAAEAHFGAPYLHAHRADLVGALLAALARLGAEPAREGADPGSAGGPVRIRLGARVARVSETADGVRARLDSGEEVPGSVLVGADGIHSIVRARLFGPDTMRYSGTAWRALAPAAAVRSLGIPRVSGVWWGPCRSFVHYYVSGGERFNWIGIVPYDRTSIESWTSAGDPAEVLREFADWDPLVHRIIEATAASGGTLYKWALFDREPLDTWVKGRMGLLGDAAHSMLPYHAQGAAQAIEDAWVLGACIERYRAAPVRALARYEALRLERGRWVQTFSRAAERHYHLVGPEARRARDERLRAAQARWPSGFPPGQETLYGYDVTAVTP